MESNSEEDHTSLLGSRDEFSAPDNNDNVDAAPAADTNVHGDAAANNDDDDDNAVVPPRRASTSPGNSSHLSKLLFKQSLITQNVRRASLPILRVRDEFESFGTSASEEARLSSSDTFRRSSADVVRVVTTSPSSSSEQPQEQQQAQQDYRRDPAAVVDYEMMLESITGGPDDDNTSVSMTFDALNESHKIIEINKKAAEFKMLFHHNFPAGGGIDDIDISKTGKDKEYPIEVRMENLTYQAPVDPNSSKIKTVYNSSMLYKTVKLIKRLASGENIWAKPETQMKTVLDDVDLIIKPGKMYLILGNPGSGKTSLLKAIAGRLSTEHGELISGRVSYNGKTLQEKSEYFIENAVAYIDQLDNHEPRLTVDETFEFAFQCKTGGSHIPNVDKKNEEEVAIQKKLDKERVQVNIILEALGLSHVKDTFVGNDIIRGVSGGQRRRVTVGEMLMERTPILCGDEISTGLDALSTYEMIQLLMNLGRIQKMARVISLLQPSPETVSLFDEVIVIDEGKILYAGPIDEVEQYFASLGYTATDQMDVADFLTAICTPDAHTLFQAPQNKSTTHLPSIEEGDSSTNRQAQQQQRSHPYSSTELAAIFRKSRFAKRIKKKLKEPPAYVWDEADLANDDSKDNDEENNNKGKRRSIKVSSDLSQWYAVKQKFANSFLRAAYLNMKRSITVWTRDKRTLIAGGVKNILMGVSVGGVFFQTQDETSILGCFFQSMLFITLGAMQVAPGLVDDRSIFQKHAAANFYSAYPFVLGKAISQIPQSLIDIFEFGTILYFMVGLTPTAENFFVFVAVLFLYALVTNQFLSMFAAIAPTKAIVQVASACIVLLLILFGGFIVPPNAIPDYFIWIFWWNPFAWAFRAVVVNEFTSSRYDQEESEAMLLRSGFEIPHRGDGEEVSLFGKPWVYYSFYYMLGYFFLSLILTGIGLANARTPSASPSNDNNKSDATATTEDPTGKGDEDVRTTTERRVEGIPFIPVELSFEDICYDVNASKGKEKLRLLNDINGVFRPGRMCALMGSSGAGKTTLMDVIALRKNTGTCSGETRMNGFLQDPVSFRRASGYVYQFDVQSPELTVRETILFSAQLRLNPEHVQTEELKEKFVDYILKVLELQPLADTLVGSEEEGGLSFEQRKRLSIAVELAASPSIIFLDEPTSGLDARNALLVVKLLRRISDSGRTIIATIHQPSSSVFEMFHDLLLLKKGGKVVYFGPLGQKSSNLIQFFESRGVRPIDLNENPANWMLDVLASEEEAAKMANNYKESDMYTSLKKELDDLKVDPKEECRIVFKSKFASTFRTRQKLVSKRISLIYWRSPAYNLSRMLVSGGIAFILGSVFIADYRAEQFSESLIRAFFAVIFLSFIIVGILSMLSVLPVMVKIRDMYYRHLAAGMIDSTSLAWALGVAEKGFVVLSSILFCFVFIVTSGLFLNFNNTVAFWGFFTFNTAIYSYFGQCFVCLVKSMRTASILATVFIGINNFFSGLIVRPQFLTGFFNVPFWITPGHFVYEGMIVSAFSSDTRPVVADYGTEFYEYLNCSARMNNTIFENSSDLFQCEGTVSEYVHVFFGGRYNEDNIWLDAVMLGVFLTLARVSTFLALRYINLS